MSNEIVLKISGMKCDGCVNGVKTALHGIKGVISADVDLSSAIAIVRFNQEKPDINNLIAVVKNAGFDAIPV
jgi:copper chaperone